MSRSLQQPIFRLIKFHKLEKMAENLIIIKAANFNSLEFVCFKNTNLSNLSE